MFRSIYFFLLVAFGSLSSSLLSAQDSTDLLKLVNADQGSMTQYVSGAFNSSRVIMQQSVENIAPGTMDFRILHRFGLIKGGGKELFGLDNAYFRMSFDFGITKDLMAGIGRSTSGKEYDGFLKYRLLHQSTGAHDMPVTVSLVVGTTLLSDDMVTITKDPNSPFADRMGYFYQVILGRKFNERISLQVSPTLIHRNYVQAAPDKNDLYALGFGGRCKITHRLSLTADYFYLLNDYSGSGRYNAFSLGVDIETGGHVFQLHVTNATGMNERAEIADTNYNWGKGEIALGFNLSRNFNLKKNRKITFN
ncbi:DUF5777 family beta-barrel protein [Flavitalea flava]